jgi:hypothetical protein
MKLSNLINHIRNHSSCTIEALEEDIPVRGNAMASDDDAYDKEVEDKIIDDLNSGNVWAWCTVKLTMTHIPTGVSSDQYLGACSYKNEEDFKTGNYFEDMKEQAYTEIGERLLAIEDYLTNLK